MQAVVVAPHAHEIPRRALEPAAPMEAVVRAEALALREDHRAQETAVRTVAELLLLLGGGLLSWALPGNAHVRHALPDTRDVVLCAELLIAGGGLWRRQSWARVLATVALVEFGVCVPCSVLLGFAMLVALWGGKAHEVFTEGYREAVLLTPQVRAPGRSVRLLAGAVGVLILGTLLALKFVPGEWQR